jgi:predicted nuclease with TOPRIM domain
VSSESEILKARRARIKVIIEFLENECAESAEAQAKFDRLKAEMEAIRDRLKVIDLP